MVSLRKVFFLTIFLLLSGAVYYSYNYFFLRKFKLAILGLHNYPEVLIRKPLSKFDNSKLVLLGDLKKSILSLPFVRKVKVEKCNLFSINCFVADIKEELPAYKFSSGEQLLLYSEKNNIIWQGLVSQIQENNEGSVGGIPNWLKPLAQELPLVEIDPKLNIPDKFKFISTLVPEIVTALKKGHDLSVATIKFQNSNVFSIKFKNHEFEVFYSFRSGFDSNLFELQNQRLKKVLIEVAPRLSELESISLDYEKMAIVKFKDVIADQK